MKRAALALLLAAGCTRKPQAPPAPPLYPQVCGPTAFRVDDPPLCLALPDGWGLSDKVKEPAFDRTTLTFSGPDGDGPEVQLVSIWFANGRPDAAREADYRVQLAGLGPKPYEKLLARGPTADGNGEYLELEEANAQGKVFSARSVVRSAHYRIRCEVRVEQKRDEALLGACKTLSPPP